MTEYVPFEKFEKKAKKFKGEPLEKAKSRNAPYFMNTVNAIQDKTKKTFSGVKVEKGRPNELLGFTVGNKVIGIKNPYAGGKPAKAPKNPFGF